jgi:pyruvate kinase
LLQAAASSAVESVIDCQGCLLTILSDSSAPVRMAAKYRPGVPLLVVTRQPKVSSACSLIHGAVTVVVGTEACGLGKNELIKLVRQGLRSWLSCSLFGDGLRIVIVMLQHGQERAHQAGARCWRSASQFVALHRMWDGL